MQAEKRPILRACDACRIRKRKCDGEQPCRNCSKTANHMDDKSVPNCTYTSAIKKRGPKKGYKDNLLHRLESLEAVLNPLSEMTKLEDVATWADRQQEHQPPIVVEEEEFELHLLRLGILYSQLSSNYRLSLIQSYNTAFHQKSIHPSLRMALCANGVFYSNHSYFNSFSNESETPKAALATKFLEQANRMLPSMFANEMELVDSIRAMLMIVDVYVCLGKQDEAATVNTKMQNLIDQKHVFDPSLFQIINPAHIMCTTVDDLVFGKCRQIVAPVKTDEIIERFQLWHEYLAVNTFTSMATLKDFTIDETLYPEIFDHAALMFLYQNIGYQVPADYSRLCAPVLARNTLWENSNMASTFDDVREMSCLAASHFTKPLLKYRINLVRLVRRSVRYSRESRMCSVHRFASDNLLSLHNGLLYHFEDLPDLFKPFSSLVPFQPLADNLNLIINNVNRSFSSFGQDLLLLMVGFIYTHLPNISDISRKFRVDSKNAKILLSSAEIILTVLKAVGFIIRSLYTPINGPEMHSQGTNLLSGIPVSIVSQGNTPAPGLATFESALALYIIASSSCLVSKQNLQFSHVVGLFIKQCYLPALQKIGNVKPIANEYVKKLAAVTQ